ncbi:hypothetical protein VTK73DRAFT_1827 [Phialemonium thermophilum]|uniref:Uncharacterized protein n=1 Tax=Phialemonium thermophilum TaxID=223376 RepID=A0ABR3VT03_9PEZI
MTPPPGVGPESRARQLPGVDTRSSSWLRGLGLRCHPYMSLNHPDITIPQGGMTQPIHCSFLAHHPISKRQCYIVHEPCSLFIVRANPENPKPNANPRS